jgi:hypothetical protein
VNSGISNPVDMRRELHLCLEEVTVLMPHTEVDQQGFYTRGVRQAGG